MSAGEYREPVKVVIISTHYVQTDARSFKSVVQKLTGKDSSTVAAWEDEPVLSNKSNKEAGNQCTVVETEISDHESKPILTRETSFNELDRLIRVIPNALWNNID